LGEGGVHVAGVEKHQGVEHEAERADLVFHALVVLVQLPVLAVEDLPRQGVAAFVQVRGRLPELRELISFTGWLEGCTGRPN
jgi:hypothetical protein